MEENNNNIHTTYLKLTNPFIFTAEDSLGFFAEFGDNHTKKMTALLGYKEKDANSYNIENKNLKNAISIYKEIRYLATNNLFSILKNHTFLDLGCGFTPRSLWVASSGKKYIGADLPFIINRIVPVIEEIIPIQYSAHVEYKELDVTNPTSVELAIHGNTSPLFISTEGLLMYLSNSELDVCIDNIYRILNKHGGYWITMDIEIRSFTLEILKAIYSNDLESLKSALNVQKSNTTSFLSEYKGFSVYDNDLYQTKDILTFFQKKGFNYNKIPLSSLISNLATLNNVPENIKKNILDLLHKHYIYVLMKNDFYMNSVKPYVFSQSFRVEGHISFNQLTLRVCGRIDSLTAEKLLSAFTDLKNNNEFDTLIINLKEVEYISSAGLRAFLIMYKSINEYRRFLLTNCNDKVMDVLELSGMINVFNCTR